MFFLQVSFSSYFTMGMVLFFFKQKTAYEMRISDWSSDVCSSDLRLLLRRALHDHRELAEREVDERNQRFRVLALHHHQSYRANHRPAHAHPRPAGGLPAFHAGLDPGVAGHGAEDRKSVV